VKFYCLADEDTVRGFRLAGVEGRAVTARQDAEVALEELLERRDLGILIVSDVVAADLRHKIDEVRSERVVPLIVEIPGPKGSLPGRKTLRQSVQEAIGIRLGQVEDA
jgi:V/A-type H+/Na+-transporting ATPase subunit F